MTKKERLIYDGKTVAKKNNISYTDYLTLGTHEKLDKISDQLATISDQIDAKSDTGSDDLKEVLQDLKKSIDNSNRRRAYQEKQEGKKANEPAKEG